jgi:hypothetical protein
MQKVAYFHYDTNEKPLQAGVKLHTLTQVCNRDSQPGVFGTTPRKGALRENSAVPS